ncbi:hypothetical protein [uncultured Acetobacteroides sp.]|uniref:hypothetical protein n=1 Tax=uncultured Acetobacteroides sp. TaxID=1760811 RepID=UPI0029F54966|nr:hypothetical protein [uncultured Acetobacteroides sp.]
MNISQLIKIANYISDGITRSGISEHYQRLIGFCTQALKGNAADGELLGKELELLKGSLCEVNPQDWEKGYLRIFEKLENPSLLGAQASDRLQLLFEKGNGDYSALVQELENNSTRVVALQGQLKQLVASLEPLVRPLEGNEYSMEMEERNHLLQISFDEALFIKDINQLEKFCRIWSSILNAFTTLTREDATMVRIYDLESSSITFYAGIRTLNALSKGTYLVLCQYERILAIKRMQQEIAELEMSNGDEVIALLEEEVAQVVDDAASCVASDLIDRYEWDQEEESGVSVYGMVQTALKQTLSFVERGGRIYSNHSSDLKGLNERIVSMLQKQQEVA